MYYQKSIGELGCTSFELKRECNISLSALPNIRLDKKQSLVLTLPTIVNGTAPYQYNWEITSQSGAFSNYVFYGSSSIELPIIAPLTTFLGGAGSISIKLTVTDANRCTASTSTSYTIIG